MVSSIDIVTVKLPQKFHDFAANVAEQRCSTIAKNPNRRDRVRGRDAQDVTQDIRTGTLGELAGAKWVGHDAFVSVGEKLCDKTKTHDDGVDFLLKTPKGDLKFDAKAAQSRGISAEGALWNEFDLQVSCDIGPDTIYVIVFLDADGKHAHLIGWIYGRDLKHTWDGQCPWNQLRTMRELRDIIDAMMQ